MADIKPKHALKGQNKPQKLSVDAALKAPNGSASPAELNAAQVEDAKSTLWDVVVIGGGPAGMMAAGRAAERGAKVLLFEKNDSLGKKLLITGGGRCNVTNAEFDDRILLEKFKDAGKFLFSAFSQWSVKETLNFFHTNLMETKVEALKRVFPVSDKAQSVWDVLVKYIKHTGVTVVSNTPVLGFEINASDLGNLGNGNEDTEDADEKSHERHEKIIKKSILGVKIKGGIIKAKHFILATGGKSRPETGSTGDGFKWLTQIGHTVIEPKASLVPIAIEDAWVKRLQGVTLQDIKITLMQHGQKQQSANGRILFTHFGISGPTILNMSHDIDELLKYGEVEIALDIMPKLDHGQLNAKLQEIFKEHSNKKFKNSIGELVQPALAPIIVELSGIDPETWSHSITREQRLALIQLLKSMTMKVEGLLGLEKAIITSGGVSLDEVDFKTMNSRLFGNLGLVGDILNIDRPSGGYSLQLCWTTGFVAGDSVDAVIEKFNN